MDRGRWPLRPKGLTHDSAAGWLYPRREGLNATSGLGLNGVGKPRDVRDVARHEYPRAIEFVDNLPTTTSGKIMRGELRGRRREQLPRTPGHRLGRRHCVLTPSTSFAYPQVVSRTFASFRVSKCDVYAAHQHFCSGFDSRQLHKRRAAEMRPFRMSTFRRTAVVHDSDSSNSPSEAIRALLAE
jgi:hypothetical protein